MNLSTKYLGLNLKNPVVAAASPLSKDVEGIKALEESGVSAVVLFSIFEEQFLEEEKMLDHFLQAGSHSSAEASSYFPEVEDFNLGPVEYLNLIRDAKKAVKIPVIGSLNGVTSGGWVDFAQKIEEAGADALELNVFYLPTSPDMTGGMVEKKYLDAVSDVVGYVKIPVSVKMHPYFSGLANISREVTKAGAKGLVLFNRFYQPDIDLEKIEVVPQLKLSQSYEMLLPLRWTAILAGRVDADIALTSGVHSGEDVVKAMMAGAKVTMIASELLKNGLGRVKGMIGEMEAWMEKNDYASVEQMQGSLSQKNVPEPAAFARANYMKTLQSWRPDARY